MTDGSDLLAAILEHPAEDTPRLMYADWLQENGDDARAEFIRAQVRLGALERACPRSRPLRKGDTARLNRAPTAEEFELEKRADELLDVVLPNADFDLLMSNAVKWSAFGDPAAFLPEGHADYRRGFVESVTLTAADWLAHADAILAAHPVRKVVLTTRLAWDFGWRNSTARLDGRERYHNLRGHSGREGIVATLLRAEWPGVEFDLPPYGERFDDINETLRLIRDAAPSLRD